MYKTNIYWDKFKQELISIVLISALNVLWCFVRPDYAHARAPWNTILPVIMSIISVACTVYIFSWANKLALYFNLDYLNEAPYGALLKKIETVLLILMAHIVFFFMWYKGFYYRSNTFYGATYIISLITWLLFRRAMDRKPAISNDKSLSS